MLEHVGQEILANGEAGGDLQRASGKWTQFVNRLPSQGGVAQQLLRVWAQGPARGRKRQLGPAALEQRNAQRLFQRLNARAYGGLADTQRFRGAMKAAKRRYRQKGFDLVQFHVLARGPVQYGRIMPLDKAFLSAAGRHTLRRCITPGLQPEPQNVSETLVARAPSPATC